MSDKFFKGMLAGLVTALVLILGTFGVMTLIDSKSDKRVQVAEGQYISIVPPEERMPVTKIVEDGTDTENNESSGDKDASATDKSAESGDSQDKASENKKDNSSRVEKAQLFEKKLNFALSAIDNFFYDEMDDEKVYEAMLKAAVSSLGDPYSEYLSAQEWADRQVTTSGEYYGIGVYVAQLIDPDIVLIQYVFPDSPAERAGIMVGDELISVEGKSLKDISLDEAVEIIKGAENTFVNLVFKRNGEEFTVSVERAPIDHQYVGGTMLEDNIGYIQMVCFYENTPKQFQKELEKLEAEGMEGLIIDLRSNPGGLYYSACDCLDCILEPGKLLVYDETKNGQRTEMYSKSSAHFDKPIVIITDNNSASAAEIFTLTLQEYGKATVVGQQTYGKGIVQETVTIPYDNSAIKLTISKYFSPKGVCIHKTGVTPDVPVELDENYVADEEHPYNQYVQTAIDELKKQMAPVEK